MDVNMKMPDLATNDGVELGVARWLVEVGQPVKRSRQARRSGNSRRQDLELRHA